MTLPGRVLSRMPRTKTTPKLTRTTSPASFILADRDHRSPTPWTEKPGTVRCADWRDCDHEPVRDASRSALFFRPIPFRFRSLDAGSTRLAPAVLLLSLRRWTASVHWGRICLDGIDHGARNIGAKVDAAEGAGPGGRASTADYAPPEAWDANDCRLRQPRAPLNPRVQPSAYRIRTRPRAITSGTPALPSATSARLRAQSAHWPSSAPLQ